MSISTVIAFIKVIPALKGWFDYLVAEWVKVQIAEMKRENREAIRAAIEWQDQRDLERAIGNPRAGELSGVPGSVIRDDLPGVPRNPK